MIRDPAAAVNAARLYPPNPIPPAPSSPGHRWPCPFCRARYATDPERPGHGMTELDGWTTACSITPVATPSANAADVAAASGMTPVWSARR